MKKIKELLPAIATICAFLILWQLYVTAGFISTATLPAPTAIFQAIYEFRTIIWQHTFQTLIETLIGLSLSIVLGVITGIIIFSSDKIRKSVYPLLVLSQTIPIIALAPLLLIWFGFDMTPKIIIVVLFCFFPITVAVSDALLYPEEQYIDLLTSMKASSWQTMRYVRLPAALPAFFSGLRISTTYAITGAIVGEYVGSYQGLGIFMQTAAHSHAIVLVFAALFVAVAISLVLLTAVSIVEKFVMPWKR